nr:amidohydrolase family protein [Kineococcus siccus]
MPGFVEAHTHLGVHAEGEGWHGADVNEKGSPGARLRSLDGLDPADRGFADALAGGVTTAMILPGSGNVVGGQTAAVKTWGRTVEEMLLRAPVGVKSALGENPKRGGGSAPTTRMGVAAHLRDAFSAAQRYAARRARAVAAGDPLDPPVDAERDQEVLARVLAGELVWQQHAHRADDIATAVRLAEEFGYALVLNHVTEGHLVAGMLAERGLPAVVGPLLTSRSKPELRQRSIAVPGVLAAAGVRVALTTDHPVVPIQFLALSATLAVKEGLDRDEALRALTVNPARILRLDDRVGSLAPGLDADVVVWSGDPLDVMSRAVRVFVGGRQVYAWADGVGTVADPGTGAGPG